MLNYLNHSPFHHVYLVGMTNCMNGILVYSCLAGKSSFLNQCISFTRSKVTVKTLLSLSHEGIQISKEGLIADDHFDVDYWEEEEEVSDISKEGMSCVFGMIVREGFVIKFDRKASLKRVIHHLASSINNAWCYRCETPKCQVFTL